MDKIIKVARVSARYTLSAVAWLLSLASVGAAKLSDQCRRWSDRLQ